MGFDQAGYDCVFQVEWDKHCQQILARHWPDVPRWSDVQQVNGGELPPCDVLTFGSPCQDLSVAGKRAGLEGNKSSMFFEATRIIKEMRDATGNLYPRIAVWENVPGAIKSNQGKDFGKVLDTLADCGALEQEWVVLDASKFGVTQRRRRIFLAAIFDPDTANRCPQQLFPVAQSTQRNRQPTENIAGFYSTQGKYDVPEIGCLPPLKTVAAPCIVGETLQPRKLTPLEAERLMGWPDNHTAEQADSHRYKQCGNGVATPVAKWVADQLTKILRS